MLGSPGDRIVLLRSGGVRPNTTLGLARPACALAPRRAAAGRLIDDVATSGYNARHENRRRP